MTVEAELAKWGEPPVSGAEQALLAALDRFLEKRARGEDVRAEALLADSPGLAPEGAAVIRAAECIEQLIASVLEHSVIEGDLLSPAGAATELREGAPPGTAADLPDPFPGVYRLQKFLGEGKFGRVWLADHLRLQILVALKTLHFQVSGEARARAQAALEREARVLARLEHPNVVRVYDLAPAADGLYLVLQYVAGGSLEARLKQDGPLGWQLAARYVADIGEALGHVHGHGIVHRDVKPANILWDRRRDEALLTDFGLAARLAEAGQVAGTPLYMAPEAFRGRSSPAGDVYSLAASLFTLMTGRAPFPATTPDELLEKVRHGLPDPEPLFAGVPERLEQIIRSGLAAAPERRPALADFVAELRASLNRLLADSLVLPAAATGRAAPVDLRLTVTRWEGGQAYVPVAETHPRPRGMTRDLTKVPPPPARAGLRTGDRVRIEVVADRDGFVTVFNVGPTGHLNLLYPDPAPAGAAPPPLAAHRPLHVLDVALTPPEGDERLFAVWSRVPLPLPLEELVRMVRGGREPVSQSYRATRNMERVQASVQQLRPEDWRAVVLELEHGAS
jgi:serine/threonine-protein kinase